MDIHSEITIPGQGARHGDAPPWLSASPVWPEVKTQTGGGQLYLHQAMGLELLGQDHNLVISTGTASGKSLVFQAPTLHHLATHPKPRRLPSTPRMATRHVRTSVATSTGLFGDFRRRPDPDFRRP